MTGNREFDAYCGRLRAAHGNKFRDGGLSRKFAPYFRGPRIKVRFSCGTIKSGTVSGTTGWEPSLMLMLTRRSTGSSWLLSDKDEFLSIQRG